MTSHYDAHSFYLSEFLRKDHLEPAFNKVGRSLDDLVGIITEPEYMNHSMSRFSMCDYLFLFENNYCVPGELKGSYKRRKKAKSQLLQGKEFAQNVLRQNVDSGLLIVYNHGLYEVNKYEL